MKVKLNIIEPWEVGTESAVDATIIKKSGNQFLIFVEKNMKIRNENTQFFICLLKEEDKLIAFENHEKGVYPIQMVFDKNIRSIDSKMSEISTYRSGFMSGELII